MGVDIQTYRVRIGKHEVKKISSNSSQAEVEAISEEFFYGIIVAILLIIGCIESHPGPNTLEENFKSISEILADLKKGQDRMSGEMTKMSAVMERRITSVENIVKDVKVEIENTMEKCRRLDRSNARWEHETEGRKNAEENNRVSITQRRSRSKSPMRDQQPWSLQTSPRYNAGCAALQTESQTGNNENTEYVNHEPLVESSKVIRSALHVKLGLMKFFLKIIDKTGEAFLYVRKKFSRLTREWYGQLSQEAQRMKRHLKVDKK
ncbi:hypothetical protein C0J52_02720 [Blattella germanica]|nr:hypothetical protein C0J52_02720 [Blattella germanica]